MCTVSEPITTITVIGYGEGKLRSQYVITNRKEGKGNHLGYFPIQDIH